MSAASVMWKQGMEVGNADVDDLHAPVDDNPWFTETAWYSFWDTTHRVIGHVYLRFRPNLRVADCNLYVWAAGSSNPWDAAYWKCFQMAYPDSIADLSFTGGLHHQVIADFETYRLTYRDGDGGRFRFDLELVALSPPKWFGSKHLDQPMLVRGSVTVDGQPLSVHCRAMRDRSWYNRSDFGNFRSAYSYFLTPDEELLVLTAIPRGTDPTVSTLPVVGGYSIRNGVEQRVTGGRRVVRARRADTAAPDEVALDVELASSESVRVVGRCTHSMALAANTSMLSWMSLVDWRIGGSAAHGEDQEIWSPAAWRRFRRLSTQASDPHEVTASAG